MMSQKLYPIVFEPLGVDSKIAAKVVGGLISGNYERVGGVIRNARTKEIITWLRPISDNRPVDLTVLSRLGPLTQLTAATSLLNLSVTAVGFAMVMQRLNVIQHRLETISRVLQQINRKLDLSFYANFNAALDLARSAFAMQGEANRRTSATQAINRFLEAEHHYLGLLDMELEAGSLAISPFLNTLILAVVCVARCYLELDEIQSAHAHLQQRQEILTSRTKTFYDSVIAVNPAVFLHPRLSENISLSRLTQVLRYEDPTLTEATVFESLRARFWQTASEDPNSWLQKLPQAIGRYDVNGIVNPILIRRSRSTSDKFKLLLPRLPEAFAQVEQAVESVGCVAGYEIELGYMIENQISFTDWQTLALPATTEEDLFVLILPQESELLQDRS